MLGASAKPLSTWRAAGRAARYGRRRMFLSRLRAATADEHRRVERASPLLRPDLSLGEYAGYLRAVLGYVAPLARALAGDAAARLAFRCRTLEGDLAAVAPAGAAMACDALPALPDRAAILGCLYVVEGSTLGGRVLLPVLARRLGVGAEHGASFLAGYAVETDARWAELCAAIDGHVAAAPADGDRVIASALDTFRTFGAWIARSAA
jgi:heme oxygenase